MPSQAACILLATYNGEHYLRTQLDSIRSQSYQNWQLLVRDDCSTDGTADILKEYTELDSRIQLHSEFECCHVGATRSFEKLLVTGLDSGAKQFFLCDQDDQWHVDRLERYLHGFDVGKLPQLVFADLQLVDENLAPLGQTAAFQRESSDLRFLSLTSLLSLNHIPGCSMALNRELAELALPIPQDAIMHDWWFSLTASASGKLTYIDLKLTKYRQHASNTVGAPSILGILADPLHWGSLWRSGASELMRSMSQAEILASRLEQIGGSSISSIEPLRQYAGLSSLKLLERVKTAWRLRLRRGKPLAAIVLYLRLLCLSRPRRIRDD